jgi:hypothetical protein
MRARGSLPFRSLAVTAQNRTPELGVAVAELQWEKAVDELVLFLPFAGWTDPTDYPEYSTEYGIACSRTKASTIVLGPGIKKGGRTRRPVPSYREWRQSPGYETLENLVELFRAAAYRCESLTIYGLERARSGATTSPIMTRPT